MAWLALATAGIAGLLWLRLLGRQRFGVGTRSASEAPALDTADGAVRSSFLPLGDPQRAFDVRLALIDGARTQILYQYYLHADDESGRQILGALLNAADRGVAVKVLLDDIDIGNRSARLARLDEYHKGLEVRVFNPLVLRRWQWFEFLARFPRVTRRMHNKSLTVDGVASIVGGRNIGDEYFAEGDDAWFIDHDVLVRGALAGKIAAQFNTFWQSSLSFGIRQVDRPCAEKSFASWHETVRAARPASTPSPDLPPPAEDALGRLVHDLPDKVLEPLFHINEQSVARSIAELLRGANEEVIFSSPYLVPGPEGLALIAELRSRAVKITALTNSFASNDVWLVNSGYLDYRKKLLALGVEIHELKPRLHISTGRARQRRRVSLHAKAFIIDRHQVFVGSLNFDARSLLHNTEMGVVFEHPDCARLVQNWVSGHLGHAAYEVHLGDDGRLQWREHHRDGSSLVHRVDPGTSAFARGRTWLASWLPVEWLL